MGMCDCCICGCYNLKTAEEPEHPIKEVYCPSCSSEVDVADIYENTYFTLFFIPLFPIKKELLYAGCNNCKAKFAKTHVKFCKGCKNIILDDYRYCGRCGDSVDITSY